MTAGSSPELAHAVRAADERARHGARGRAGATGHPRSRRAAFVELTKPRITLLLLITCVAAMFAAVQGMPDLRVLAWTSLGLALSSGGASALNHVLDRDIDRLMVRTASRPVATGQVSPAAGAAFGIALMALAGLVLGAAVNGLAAVLALAGGLFYVLGYTVVLKRTTTQNIVIGGAAGAVPPLVGWAAVTGSLAWPAWALFGIVFLWTPPHFWALALLIREEYAAAGVPMLPVVRGERTTAEQVWWYTLALAAFSLAPVATGDLGLVYAVVALALGGWLGRAAWRLRAAARRLADGEVLVGDETPGRVLARSVFLRSMGYLALLFAAVVVDRAAWTITLVG